MIIKQNTLNLQDVVMVERDYKGEYERAIMSFADFKETYPDAATPDMSCQTETLRPMVHILYSRPKSDDELIAFLTDMEDGLPESDVAFGNTAYLREDLFSDEYVWMFKEFEEKMTDMTNTPKGKIKMLFENAKELGWSVYHECDNVFNFSKYTPSGQDFSVNIDTEEDPDRFLHNLFSVYEEFDVSEEAYLWLGTDGHGKNGAPYDMKDVYEDMESCRESLNELYMALHDCYYDEVR